MPARLVALYRHPVKGFTPEAITHAELAAGGYFPGDRLYAVENGDSGFDPADPQYRQKTAYLMLMRDARLAALKATFDPKTSVFSLALDGAEAVRGDLSSEEGRAEIASFLTFYMGHEAKGPLKVLAAPPTYRFMDSPRSGFVSLLNLASVSDLEARMAMAVDPLRFRMNLHVDGFEPGSELEWVGRTLQIGGAEGVRLTVVKRTERCAAVNVNPDTAERDLNVVKGLAKAYGHVDCGIYLKVAKSGRIALGDEVELL